MFFVYWEMQYNENDHSYGQLEIGSFITTMLPLMYHVSSRVFLVKYQITEVTQPPLKSRFHALWLLAYPKTKITFKREEISDHQWDSGKYDKAADGDWENCVRPQGAYFEGDWNVIVLCTMFLVSCIFFNKCLYFSYYLARNLLDRPRIFQPYSTESLMQLT